MAISQDPFVAQLAELCRAECSRAKWVFVPTRAVGLTLGDCLAREGCDWANLRFVTSFDIPVELSGAGRFAGAPQVRALAALLGSLADPVNGAALVRGAARPAVRHVGS